VVYRVLTALHKLWLGIRGWLVAFKPCRIAVLMVFAVLVFLVAVPQGQDVVRALAER
jgi:hypothetical protein